MTNHGMRYLVDDGYTPTVHELAQVLARVPRWNGQTVVPWSVLQHSLALATVVGGRGGAPTARLEGLLHDVEEAVVGDVPRPFKTDAQRDLGEEVRAGLYRKVFGLPPTFTEGMHELDDEIAAAEAAVLGHPRWLTYFGSPPSDDAVEVVWDLHTASIHESIYLWESQVRDLLEDATVKALQRRYE